MLLRLLPLPTPQQPSPPTILFTLPLPSQPYTGRSLPLPANLHAHRSVCLQEDIECPNVLLGEKSSWIGGIIDEITFALTTQLITVRFIDSTSTSITLTPDCTRHLARVIEEVRLSFQPAPVAPVPEATPRASTSSVASTQSNASASSSTSKETLPSARRTPSSLLLSFLSPLLNNAQDKASSYIQPPPPAQPPARVHRRQARSLLVDAYNRHVLPHLRDILPSAYLIWIIASETAKRMVEFEKLREEINTILASSNVGLNHSTPMKRSHSSASTPSHTDDDDSDSDAEGSPITPATSIFSHSPSECNSPRIRQELLRTVSPHSYLLSLPPALSLPEGKRVDYSNLLARLSLLTSRLSSIKKLNAKYEREEGKRRWLESLERGRMGDKALKRAASNGEKSPGVCLTPQPTKRSGLWRSWSLDEQIRSEAKDEAKAVHPAMMESIEEGGSSCSEDGHSDMASESGSDTEEGGSVTPKIIPRVYIPAEPYSPFNELDRESTDDKLIETVITVNPRPPLERAEAVDDVPVFTDEHLEDRDDDQISNGSNSDTSDNQEDEVLLTPTAPHLTSFPSLESSNLPSNWQQALITPTKALTINSISQKRVVPSGLSAMPKMRELMDWERRVDAVDGFEETETYGGVEVVYA